MTVVKRLYLAAAHGMLAVSRSGETPLMTIHRPKPRARALATVLALAALAGPAAASNVNYYYDPNGRLIASTRMQGLNENYAYDQADNRTSLNTGHQNSPNVAGQMSVNQGLTRYQSLSATDNSYLVTLQADGNVVIYSSSGVPMWSTNTHGLQSASFALQADGNLVLRDAYGNSLWSSNTSGSSNTVLKMLNTGHLVLYDGAKILWTSPSSGN